jgi:hypothetical protein
MPANTTVTVGTSAVLLATGTVPLSLGGQQVGIVNTHATNGLFIGGSNAVTAANGFRVPSGTATNAPFMFNIDQGEQVWAIASAAATDVRVILFRA